ncbi:MAG TPA: phosphatidic acid phosphatase [Leeuwenhoekiella sp.]|nr:phosphatidic acid phosphatase [Leeuwenhoekiella sp.]HAX16815.1 phosphatidic acid phosphatase [Leeuwenhoekiella sp.]HBO30643.1 phosphatidic acid phosphatase [Leeuwenhoekiella sp.]HCQ77862.1 phosphatidic acid phosphatase [Leeuwenhoekiella sp.]|tara:strand:- start:2659 stop:4008 length:1350 start_codon:yes stop_codon:yes gene_type:complete
MLKKLSLLVLSAVLITSCSKEEKPLVVTPDDYNNAVDKVTEVIIHDIFSPPVASRIYAYSNMAAYEVLVQNNSDYKSLAGQIHELGETPKPDADAAVNYDVAALVAQMEMAKSLIFSEDRITEMRDSLYLQWEEQNPTELEASKAYGLKVADHIKAWMDGDMYKQTRTMPKFSVNPDNPSRWQPTPPAYMDGIEPHWMKIRTLVIDSADQFKPIPPPAFSMEEGSEFHKQLMEVYDVRNAMTEEGDESEKMEIAKFWDCNPYVSTHKGHLMFATKKITPGGHWIGIVKIATKKANADLMETVYVYTKTSVALFDGFISCWDEKYRSNLIRPETLINQYIDDAWAPVLQTPPFPEYSSGHSVVSGAAAEVLTQIYGDNFQFDDDTETAYGLPVRSFDSFRNASSEAALSRLYGGIHYRAAIEEGLKQGRQLGQFIAQNLQMKTNTAQASN